MVASLGGIAAIAATLAPYLPVIGKFALGFLPTNATKVVDQVVTTVRQGIAIAQPVLNTLGAISANSTAAQPGTQGEDISLSQMDAALMALKTPGAYEDAMKEAKKDMP